MNAFHVIGILFAAWAIVLFVVGMMRDDFPKAGVPTLAVGIISVALAGGTIGSGVVTSANEEEEEAAEAAEPGEGALKLTADPGGQFRFDETSLEARAGRVTIEMDNPSSVPHNVSIEGDGLDEQGDTVDQGGTSEVTAELEPGEYVFYCSVPGHRDGGMEGTLTVR